VALAILVAMFACLIGGRGASLFGQSPNPIQAENQNPGTSSWLLTNVAANREIEGYASLTSVNAGEQISFFVNTIDPSYTLTIYRLGYYGGLGGRQMMQPVTLGGISQPIPTPDPTYGMAECQWVSPYVLTVPSNWVSGIYLVKLVGSQSGKQRYIVFVVRNDGRVSDFIFKSGVTTYQAYNAWGGKSLYTFNSTNSVAAVKVSYNRPYDDNQGTGRLLQWELDMLAFLEQEGYDVVYNTDVDTHESPAQLMLHKGFLSVGHDEYWSYEMRQNVTAARDQGVNLGFFSADTANWQIRFETSPISGALDRTEVGYKELWKNDPDASNPATYYLITANWGTTRFTYPGQPEDALVGSMYNGYEPVNGDIVVGNASSWVFANTGLTNGSVISGLLGYEVSEEKGHQPANTVLLAHSPYTYADGSTQYGDMTVYQAASGATVFSTGTVQWMWGLSHMSPWGSATSLVNPAAQQITRNVLAQFINSPGSVTGPSATPTPSALQITAPANGATVAGTVSIALAKAAAASWVNVYVDGKYFASTPPMSFNWNSSGVANGGHTISATAFSSSGASLGTASVVVNVQNGVVATHTATPAPTTIATPIATQAATPAPAPSPGLVQITAPGNGAIVSGTVSIVLAKASSVTWADFYVDGNYLGATPPLTFSWNSSAVANGVHTISATAYNSSSATVGTASISVNVQNGAVATHTATPTAVATKAATPAPTPAPSVVQITAPSNAATVSGTINIGVTIASGVTWADVYIDGNYFASTPPLNFAWNSKTVSNGAHTISVQAFSSTASVLGKASLSVTVAN
jgi:hypothetical protein